MTETLRRLSGIDHGWLMDACNSLAKDRREALSGLSDLDVVVEHRGHFLVIECKQPGENVSVGQEIMLRKVADSPSYIVLIVRLSGKRTSIGATCLDPTHWRRYYREAGRVVLGPWVTCTIEQFAQMSNDWWVAAKRGNTFHCFPDGVLNEDQQLQSQGASVSAKD